MDLPDAIRNRADLEALLRGATNYEERLPRKTERPPFRLDRVRAMLASLGDPQEGPRTVHLAGSKGKGSTARMIATMLRASPRGPVGLYTSPHLEDLAERIEVDGERATDAELAEAAHRLLPHVRRTVGTPDAVSFFEILTGVAWWVFRARGCTDVVLETGLGGRLDATNVCRPAIVLITPIEREHANILGDDLSSIAAEKAGILKPGIPAVTAAEGEALAAIESRARDVGAPLTVLGRDLLVSNARTGEGPRTEVCVIERRDGDSHPLEVTVPLAGTHHAANVALAVWAARRLGLADETMRRALADARLPGIVEKLDTEPLVVVDGAHTAASAAATRAAVDACWPGRRVVLLVAFLQGKDVEAVLAPLLPGVGHVLTTALPTPRTVTAEATADAVRRLAGASTRGSERVHVEARPDPRDALARARALASPDGLVLATGSVRLAGAVRALLRGT